MKVHSKFINFNIVHLEMTSRQLGVLFSMAEDERFLEGLRTQGRRDFFAAVREADKAWR